MPVVVIEGPAPIVTPDEIPGSHASDDAVLRAAIAAAQAEIDGPTGTLGRALGEQTLDETGWWGGARIPLSYGPVIEIVGIFASEADGPEQRVDPSSYRLRDGDIVLSASAAGAAWVRLPRHRIRYRAGCDGRAIDEGGTGPVPAQAKAAVMLMAQDLRANAAADGGLRSFSADGAFAKGFNSPDLVQKARTATVERLLFTLRRRVA